jgi:hypothetical protein
MTTNAGIAAVALAGAVRCAGCNATALRIDYAAQTLVIEHKHHGERHTTTVPLSYILDKAGGAKLP